jgi:NADPH-dependent ferric siderophore reductase
MPVDDPILAMVGQAGGPLADATLWSLTVAHVDPITDDYRRVTFEGPDLGQLVFRPGQDLMLRIPTADDRAMNRRYTIRSADLAASTPTVSVDMVVHGDGPGARWAGAARPGHTLEAIGPRGGVFVDDEADWHLFVGDETGLPGMSIMAESLPPGVPGILVVELPAHVAGHDLRLAEGQDVSVIWIERGDAEPGDAHQLVAAVKDAVLPAGRGHAYVAGEMKVVRAVVRELADRGLEGPAVNGKAYWRRGGANAAHGEPLDPDRPPRAR